MLVQKKILTSTKWIYVFLLFIFLVELVLLRNTPFFWDASSKALRANWFFLNDFESILLPTALNAGHPPLWPLLLAFVWKLFGQSLLVSRILFFFINLAVFFQVVLFADKYLPRKKLFIGIVLLIAEPSLLAQTSIMNNDMILLFFTLLGLNSILQKNYLLLTIGLTGVLFTNLRGIGIFISLFLIHIFIDYSREGRLSIKWRSYLVSGVLFVAFLVYHYFKLGWILFTPSEGWSSQREQLSILGMLRNIIVILFDFAMYGKYLLFIALLILLAKQRQRLSRKAKELGIIFIVFTSVLSILMIPFSNPISVRYYLISYIIAILLLIELCRGLPKLNASIIYFLVFISLITGHLWVFPSKISQPWDSSLAYLNYFPVEKKMERFIESKSIPRKKIGTPLPLNDRNRNYLSHKFDNHQDYASLNFEENNYILYSNIDNSIKDNGIDILNEEWVLIQSYTQNGVFIKLYKKGG